MNKEYSSTPEKERLYLICFCNLYSLYKIFSNYDFKEEPKWTEFLKIKIPENSTNLIKPIIARINALTDQLGNTISIVTDNGLISSTQGYEILEQDFVESTYLKWCDLIPNPHINPWLELLASDIFNPCPMVNSDLFDSIAFDYSIFY